MVTPTFLASGGTSFDAAKLVKSSRNAQQDKNDLILKHSSDDCYLKLKKKRVEWNFNFKMEALFERGVLKKSFFLLIQSF